MLQSMGSQRVRKDLETEQQKDWIGLSFLSPGDLPGEDNFFPGVKSMVPALE